MLEPRLEKSLFFSQDVFRVGFAAPTSTKPKSAAGQISPGDA
jgi:hypothetical protein